MLIVERQDHLLETLRRQGVAQLEELARELDVSVSTVRRDLETMERRGIVERTHGGAIYRGEPSEPPGGGEPASTPLSARMNEHVAQKQAIGRAAAAMVQPHMTLLLDGGSTVIYAARQIIARPLQVVTNSLSIANHFADQEDVELLLVGGSFYPRTGVTFGPIATGSLADLHADLLFYSLAGIYSEEAYNINLVMAEVEQVMMRQAAQSVMLMDSSKFGRKSLVRVCGLAEVHRIITDGGVGEEWRQQLGERLVVAE
ncbi:MAG: DeoR/GlpR family DNA-binding transcription regulator [Phycisphaeraceae bacterium]